MNGTASGLENEGVTALAYMEQALQLLDGCKGAMDVGGHLDLAICRLRDILEDKGIAVAPRPPQNLI
jgi:hypothetical protein